MPVVGGMIELWDTCRSWYSFYDNRFRFTKINCVMFTLVWFFFLICLALFSTKKLEASFSQWVMLISGILIVCRQQVSYPGYTSSLDSQSRSQTPQALCQRLVTRRNPGILNRFLRWVTWTTNLSSFLSSYCFLFSCRCCFVFSFYQFRQSLIERPSADQTVRTLSRREW